MIIHDFDVVCFSIQPCETNPKLIVDPNTVLASAISFKRFQPDAREPEIFKRGRRIQKFQPDARRLFNRLKSSAKLPAQKPEDILVPAGTDHMLYILQHPYSCLMKIEQLRVAPASRNQAHGYNVGRTV
jgi:hypothetical protein